MSAAKEKTTADWLEVKSELARVTAERDAAWERLDEFGSGGLVYGISAMRAALIDAVRRADVQRAEMEEQQRQYAENLAGREQQYQAELRRVAEAVRDACDREYGKYVNTLTVPIRVDLGAILRGGK